MNKSGRTIIIMSMIVMVLALCSVTVQGKENKEKNDKAYYRQLEDTFTEVIRNTLTKDGYTNCGITVNSISKLGEDREYTVMIHHHLISDMNDDEREQLLSKLETITYPYEDCLVSYEFVY